MPRLFVFEWCAVWVTLWWKEHLQNEICRWMLCLTFAWLWIKQLLGLSVHGTSLLPHMIWKWSKKTCSEIFVKPFLTKNDNLQNFITIINRKVATVMLPTQNTLKKSFEVVKSSTLYFQTGTFFPVSWFNYSILKFQFLGTLLQKEKGKYKSKAYKSYLTKHTDWLKLTNSVHWKFWHFTKIQ